MSNHLATLFESVASPRVLVVGDIMLDHYVWGEASRISPEGPIPVLRVTSDETRPGGAGNVASALSALGASVTLCGVIGADEAGRTLSRHLECIGAECGGVIRCRERPTTVKTRYFGYVQSAHRGIQHMLRVDRESTEPIPDAVAARLFDHAAGAMSGQQAVILSDYEKGVLTEDLLQRLISLASERGIPVVTDPKRSRPYSIYRGSTVLTPNRYEAQVATGIAPRDAASIAAAARRLLEIANLRHVVITLDRDGMYLAGEGEEGRLIPTRPREVIDVTGAGDIAVSAIAFMLAAGAPIADAVAVANVAAGIEVGKIGATPVSRDEILAELLGGDDLHRKLMTLDRALALAEEIRRRNGKVVWTNGCFDLFHVGHIEYLRFARRQGDLLIVGLNSDASVRRLKGPGRPITSEGERARLLAALDVVDCIVLFDGDTPERLIKAIKPDVLVKGGDYQMEEVVGRELVESWGGRVALAPIVEGISTSAILNRVLDLHHRADGATGAG